MDLICRFVYKDGTAYGESIDIFENCLIVKVIDKFVAIPLKNVTFDGDKILVGDFDEKKGFEIANKWLNKSKAVDEKELKAFGFGEEDGI